MLDRDNLLGVRPPQPPCPYCGAPGARDSFHGILRWGCGSVDGHFGMMIGTECRVWQVTRPFDRKAQSQESSRP